MNKAVTKLHPEVEITDPAMLGLARLREPFHEDLISKLPKESKAQREERERDRSKGVSCTVCGGWHHKNAVHLDYVGHAALTDRLLDVDPLWSWEPMATTPEGAPQFDKNGGLWIKLTVCGVTRLGYGSADGKSGGDAVKEVIGDALRNAAMRFGAALDLWHKGGDLHSHREEPAPSAEELAINLLRGCASKELFKEAWEKNKDGWKGVMEPAAYARVVAEMRRIAGTFQKDSPPAAEAPAPAPPPPEERPISRRAQPQAADGFGLGDDDIPDFGEGQ